MLLSSTMLACSTGNDDGVPDAGPTDASGACGTLQASCTTASQCCTGLACPTSAGSEGRCCSRAGGSCTEDYDCCFGKCSGGKCGCSTPKFLEGCITLDDCCEESPDHVECRASTSGASYGECTFTGDIVMTTSSCSRIGTSGVNIVDYCVTISGTFEGPVGSEHVLYTDPSTTYNTPCGPPTGCNAWDFTNGLCKRLSNEGASTQYSFSYAFGSDTPLSVKPQLNLNSPGGGLDAVQPTIVCP